MNFDLKNLLKTPEITEDIPDRKEVQHLNSQKEEPTHSHEWELRASTYAPPRKDIDPEKLRDNNLERAMFGLTTMLYECLVCKSFFKEELLGSSTTQLDELIDKSTLYGPQYIQRDGATYQLGRLAPQQSQGGQAASPVLPLR